MDQEVIERGQSILEKLRALDFSHFTVMDVIYIAGVLALIILAVRVVSRLSKVVLVLLAVGLLAFWLYTQGLLPL